MRYPFMLMLFAAVAPLASAADLVRGPYLQIGTDEGVTIRWRTVALSDSRVWYGTSPNALTQVVVDASLVTEHIVTLSGLDTGTRYYYAIGDSVGVLVGGEDVYRFDTSPTTGSRERVRIWAIGDSGTGNDDARAVRDAFLGYGPGRADVWVTLGDNAYLVGSDPEHQRAVFDMYPTVLRNTVLWPTLGNHDGFTADSATESGPYYDIFSMPRDGQAGGVASGTEAYYSFDYANIHFVCLDTYETDRTTGSAMLSWLAQDLAATQQQWLIGVWHNPAYSEGHNSDDELESIEIREHILPLMESAGADLILSGHSHTYERSMLMNGHYGFSGTLDPQVMILDDGDGRIDGGGAYVKAATGLVPDSGTVYVVAGSSGRLDAGDYNHPANIVNVNALGSMVIEIEGDRLDASFLSSDGEVRDRFSIVKGGGACVADFSPDGVLDFFDVSAFIERLNARAISADLNSDAHWDFFDVGAFIAAYNAGCP